VIALSSSELHGSWVLVHTDFDRSQSYVRGDRIRIQQVILSLLLGHLYPIKSHRTSLALSISGWIETAPVDSEQHQTTNPARPLSFSPA
jgi:hypothetical protein